MSESLPNTANTGAVILSGFSFDVKISDMGQYGNKQIRWNMCHLYNCDSRVPQRADRLAGGLGFAGQVPVVQEAAMGSELELVIVESPLDSIRAGRFLQVPTMIGSVRDEGSLVTGCEFLTGLHYAGERQGRGIPYDI